MSNTEHVSDANEAKALIALCRLLLFEKLCSDNPGMLV
jgi:hypothetical protein